MGRYDLVVEVPVEASRDPMKGCIIVEPPEKPTTTTSSTTPRTNNNNKTCLKVAIALTVAITLTGIIMTTVTLLQMGDNLRNHQPSVNSTSVYIDILPDDEMKGFVTTTLPKASNWHGLEIDNMKCKLSLVDGNGSTNMGTLSAADIGNVGVNGGDEAQQIPVEWTDVNRTALTQYRYNQTNGDMKALCTVKGTLSVFNFLPVPISHDVTLDPVAMLKGVGSDDDIEDPIAAVISVNVSCQCSNSSTVIPFAIQLPYTRSDISYLQTLQVQIPSFEYWAYIPDSSSPTKMTSSVTKIDEENNENNEGSKALVRFQFDGLLVDVVKGGVVQESTSVRVFIDTRRLSQNGTLSQEEISNAIGQAFSSENGIVVAIVPSEDGDNTVVTWGLGGHSATLTTVNPSPDDSGDTKHLTRRNTDSAEDRVAALGIQVDIASLEGGISEGGLQLNGSLSTRVGGKVHTVEIKGLFYADGDEEPPITFHVDGMLNEIAQNWNMDGAINFDADQPDDLKTITMQSLGGWHGEDDVTGNGNFVLKAVSASLEEKFRVDLSGSAVVNKGGEQKSARGSISINMYDHGDLDTQVSLTANVDWKTLHGYDFKNGNLQVDVIDGLTAGFSGVTAVLIEDEEPQKWSANVPLKIDPDGNGVEEDMTLLTLSTDGHFSELTGLKGTVTKFNVEDMKEDKLLMSLTGATIDVNDVEDPHTFSASFPMQIDDTVDWMKMNMKGTWDMRNGMDAHMIKMSMMREADELMSISSGFLTVDDEKKEWSMLLPISSDGNPNALKMESSGTWTTDTGLQITVSTAGMYSDNENVISAQPVLTVNTDDNMWTISIPFLLGGDGDSLELESTGSWDTTTGLEVSGANFKVTVNNELEFALSNLDISIVDTETPRTWEFDLSVFANSTDDFIRLLSEGEWHKEDGFHFDSTTSLVIDPSDPLRLEMKNLFMTIDKSKDIFAMALPIQVNENVDWFKLTSEGTWTESSATVSMELIADNNLGEDPGFTIALDNAAISFDKIARTWEMAGLGSYNGETNYWDMKASGTWAPTAASDGTVILSLILKEGQQLGMQLSGHYDDLSDFKLKGNGYLKDDDLNMRAQGGIWVDDNPDELAYLNMNIDAASRDGEESDISRFRLGLGMSPYAERHGMMVTFGSGDGEFGLSLFSGNRLRPAKIDNVLSSVNFIKFKLSTDWMELVDIDWEDSDDQHPDVPPTAAPSGPMKKITHEIELFNVADPKTVTEEVLIDALFDALSVIPGAVQSKSDIKIESIEIVSDKRRRRSAVDIVRFIYSILTRSVDTTNRALLSVFANDGEKFLVALNANTNRQFEGVTASSTGEPVVSDPDDEGSGGVDTMIIIAAACGGVVLLLIAVIAYVYLKKKKNRNKLKNPKSWDHHAGGKNSSSQTLQAYDNEMFPTEYEHTKNNNYDGAFSHHNAPKDAFYEEGAQPDMKPIPFKQPRNNNDNAVSQA